MSRNMSINQLTEGITDRHLGAERTRLIEKWTRTGLLRGMDDHGREIMSQLLENQAAQVLREQSSLGTGGGNTLGSGDMSGFQNLSLIHL